MRASVPSFRWFANGTAFRCVVGGFNLAHLDHTNLRLIGGLFIACSNLTPAEKSLK